MAESDVVSPTKSFLFHSVDGDGWVGHAVYGQYLLFVGAETGTKKRKLVNCSNATRHYVEKMCQKRKTDFFLQYLDGEAKQSEK